ncbi:hypothetical protein K457DRAFT_694787 [Linnemannia elongata AG-77]|uniref:Uncharacterized protein n=1 Tax=Linnemannia elongata AG-77 TaxID=1314771 RepID=A0A197JMV9_9FUNG|nr:hypothetical protein K457DRAFT_694787 [Linnemannia elongata AG-77]
MTVIVPSISTLLCFRPFVCCSFTHTSCFFFHSLLFLVVLYYPQCFRHEHGCTTSSSLLLHLARSFFAPFFHLPAFMIFHATKTRKSLDNYVPSFSYPKVKNDDECCLPCIVEKETDGRTYKRNMHPFSSTWK